MENTEDKLVNNGLEGMTITPPPDNVGVDVAVDLALTIADLTDETE